MASKIANKVFNATKSKPIKMPSATSLGSAGYDNPRDDIEKIKKLREGSVIKTPVNDIDIVNKEFSNSGIQTLTNKTIDSFTNQVEADEIHIQIRNESGSTMTKGQLVYISGYNVGLDRTLVSLTDASNSSTMPMLAMINDADIVNNASGHATVSGKVFNIDTSAFSVGDSVYVSTTAGEMSTRPSGTTDQVQRIGIVLRSQMNNGVIQLIGAGRTNDIPNDIDHDTNLINVSANDHHNESHNIASHSDTTATGTELNTLTGGTDTTLHDHDGISENTTHRGSDGSDHSIVVSNQSASHTESHDVASHSDTTGTGAELNTLTDNSMADTLHRHSKLVALDGSPDPAFSAATNGQVTSWINGQSYSCGDGSNATVYMAFASPRAKMGYDGNGTVVQSSAGKPIKFLVNNNTFGAGTQVLHLAPNGNITLFLAGIPTSDPSVAGQLWRDGTDLKISLG